MDGTQFLRAIWLLLTVLSLQKSLVTAFFENCDYSYNIYSGHTIQLRSPDYPNSYPPGSSCRYKYTAPLNHIINANCIINTDGGQNDCTTEAFYISINGDLDLLGSDKLCGHGSTTKKSLFRTMVLAFISEGPRGNFNCTLSTEPKSCDCGYFVNKNITNGEDASIVEYPSMAALTTKSRPSIFFCASSIISSRYLLTAAHCVRYQDVNNIAAWVGTSNIVSNTDPTSRDYDIKQAIIHERYSPKPVQNDIALLLTSSEILFSRAVGPICLPPASNAKNDFAWENVDVIGYGVTKFSILPSGKLQKVTLMVTDSDTCQAAYPKAVINQNTLCTRDASSGRKDSCQYDSGGPVIFKHLNREYLVGIISYGNACAAVNDPIGLNTRISPYLSWINDNTNRTICSPEF